MAQLRNPWDRIMPAESLPTSSYFNQPRQCHLLPVLMVVCPHRSTGSGRNKEPGASGEPLSLLLPMGCNDTPARLLGSHWKNTRKTSSFISNMKDFKVITPVFTTGI